MPRVVYLNVAFSNEQLNLPPHERVDEVAVLQHYLKQQNVAGADKLTAFCSEEFYKRADPHRVQNGESLGIVPVQEALYVLAGRVFSFDGFRLSQKNAIELLGFKTSTEERLKPHIPF